MSIKYADISESVTVDQANLKLASLTRLPSIEKIRLEEAAGRVLAIDFASPFPLPPFRRAAMDGYAIRSETVRFASPDNPVQLVVQGEIKPGQYMPASAQKAGVNRALRIFTGAPVPDVYDAVVMQEAVRRIEQPDNAHRIQIDRPYRSGQHIAEQGEDVPSGMTLLGQGTVLGAKEIAVLASFGQMEIDVFRQPRIAVIPVGDELMPLGSKLGPGQIYEANGMMIQTRLREFGALIVRYPPVPDRLEAIETAIGEAVRQADIVVTTGGVSVGDYDLVKQAALNIGGSPLFTKVLMRPGTPTSAFAIDSRLLICLSGNPSACFAGMELLLRPAVMQASGRKERRLVWLEGRLSEPVDKPSPYPRYIRAYVYRDADKWNVEPLRNDKSGNVAAFAQANALALIPAGGAGASHGQAVRWVPLSS
ncbi:gephyrin-like molybdotransferase Glp [Paenibacillus beijingensis]|uniref:Molybdopterin molybdenumtransferase n=1 Tax=Paenibacillus beijingensis TaxID=1126833 RepID=A0A0D5NL00_9BACL|nr:gephyrin-like molybdotransferase Glp [Paenibacillus beijingensis]AJY76029.1 hypothetical protein VN24_17535 [Paenibacillus beijingensis]